MTKTKGNSLFLFTLICCSALFVAFGCTKGSRLKDAALAKAKAAVRRIDIENGRGSCSGTLISASQMITASHCIPESMTFAVGPNGETWEVAPSLKLVKGGNPMTVGFNSQYVDGAVLLGSFDGAPSLSVDTNGGLIYAVDEAILCGYPMYNDQLRCTKAKRKKNERFAALFDTTVIPGQSGGAVFSLDGVLIGIIQYMTPDGLAGVGSVTGLQSGVK